MKVFLAPMVGRTDKYFRRLVRIISSNIILFTEMINATSLKKGFGTQKINQIDLEEGPIGVQIFDNRPYAVSEAAKQAEDSGAFLIDINMGCPVKKIAKKGGGSALIKDRKLAIELVKNVVKAVKVPVTVKTRLGWDSKEENIEDFLLKLQDAGATMITLHGRTRKQGFSGNSDWEMIGRLKKLLEIPVIANGDIVDAKTASSCMEVTGAGGLMIGRGAIGRPMIFHEIKRDLGWSTEKPPWSEDNPAFSRLWCWNRYLELSSELYSGIRNKNLKRHAVSFTKGLPGASKMRVELHSISTQEKMGLRVREYLEDLTRLETLTI